MIPRGFFILIGIVVLAILSSTPDCTNTSDDWLKSGFINPPDSARPGVYWYFLDGNLDRSEITADLESMKEAGIGYAIYQEVSNTPRGKVDFLSDEWQELFKHIIREGERLGIRIVLGSSPGWTGSGGPWIKPRQSMQFLVVSSVDVSGPGTTQTVLPNPGPKFPYRNPLDLAESIRTERDTWYEDVAVLAIPSTTVQAIESADDKALYHRGFYSWVPGVQPYFVPSTGFSDNPSGCLNLSEIKDITSLLKPDGTITWEVPPGKWTLLRFGRKSNGSLTVPAPAPGLGLECDKFDTTAINSHYDSYLRKLVEKTKPLKVNDGGGWYGIHIDSWEVGSQNWSGNFREEFRKRRGYDLLPFLPVFTGRSVGSQELSERFLWDLRQTSNELIVNNYAGQLRKRGASDRLALSIEPYDSNPSADLDLGGQADIPMCEFWSENFVTFNSTFSCIEAASIAHVNNRPIVAAEAFTANDNEAWRNYPARMKNQGDWALSIGINRMFYHTFAHKVHGDQVQPGITLGPWGVHWDRNQTWWPMISGYHRYITRCQYILSQGIPRPEVLYLAGEGAPHPFRAPGSNFEGDTLLPDQRGYSFDGCSPKTLMEKASVKDHRIVFPGGVSYSLLVLPSFETMTPELLISLEELIREGAIVAGNPPEKSPSLANYPRCDQQVHDLARKIWGGFDVPETLMERKYGNGFIFWGGDLNVTGQTEPLHSLKSVQWPVLYPFYESTARILQSINIKPDFTSGGSVRYIHRSLPGREIYFVSNRTAAPVQETCTFRDGTLKAELWDAVSGEIQTLENLAATPGGIAVPIDFEVHQSFFVVFMTDDRRRMTEDGRRSSVIRHPSSVVRHRSSVIGPWNVSFDPRWGGPESVVFDSLTDWTLRSEPGIRYYSGIATYTRRFDLDDDTYRGKNIRIMLHLGTVKNIARVRLNGRDLGVVWTDPWQVEITKAVKTRGNRLDIEVANLWPNRLIGDELEPDDGVIGDKWPDWLLNGTPRPTRRYTFTTYRYYKKDDPLLESGLIGPVTLHVIH